MSVILKQKFLLTTWSEALTNALFRGDSQQGMINRLDQNDILRQLTRIASSKKVSGEEILPALEDLARVIRDHNFRMYTALETESSQETTVEQIGLLRQGYIHVLEAGVLELIFKVKISLLLIEMRTTRGLSLRGLEKNSGVSASYLSQIERIVSGRISLKILNKLDVFFHLGNRKNSFLNYQAEYQKKFKEVTSEKNRFTSGLLKLMGGDMENLAVNPLIDLPEGVTESLAGNAVKERPGISQGMEPGLLQREDFYPVYHAFRPESMNSKFLFAGEDLDHADLDEAVELLRYYFELNPNLRKSFLRHLKDVVRSLRKTSDNKREGR